MSLLNLVVIRARDMEKLARFYSGIGLHFERHRHGSGPEHLAAELSGAVFEIYPRDDESDTTTSVRLGFAVPSVDGTIVSLREIGVEVLREPSDSPWGRRAVVRDFEGHKVELTEQRSVPPDNNERRGK